jgi:hypothetical protein
MPVKVNVKRFSRSKTVEEPIIEEPIVEKKTRGRKKKVVIEEPIIEEPIIEEPIIETIEEEEPESFEIDDNFLSELNSSNYQKEVEEEANKEINLKQQKEAEKERAKQLKEQEKYMKEAEKERAKQEKVNKAKINNDSELYSENATEPQGKEKLMLLHKVKQYKNLFSDELKSYKIKPNCSINELKAYLDDMDTIINTSNVDQFITDSILQCIKLLEIPTSKTKNLNISGLSEMLKCNKEFHSLCKQLYLKYNVFSKIPPEYQLTILIATTSYICINKNKNKDSLEAYLNTLIESNSK